MTGVPIEKVHPCRLVRTDGCFVGRRPWNGIIEVFRTACDGSRRRLSGGCHCRCHLEVICFSLSGSEWSMSLADAVQVRDDGQRCGIYTCSTDSLGCCMVLKTWSGGASQVEENLDPSGVCVEGWEAIQPSLGSTNAPWRCGDGSSRIGGHRERSWPIHRPESLRGVILGSLTTAHRKFGTKQSVKVAHSYAQILSSVLSKQIHLRVWTEILDTLAEWR